MCFTFKNIATESYCGTGQSYQTITIIQIQRWRVYLYILIYLTLLNIIVCVRFRFKKSLKSMVNMSDKIGYIYWVAVLTTISFGFVTGIFESYRHKSNMQKHCNEKLNFYTTNYADQISEWDVKFENGISTVNKVRILENAIKKFNITTQLMDIDCGRPRRVYPYHIWLPFDSKITPIFQVKFMALLICIIDIYCMISF